MSTYYDKAKGCYRFTFNRIINNRLIRANKLLPKQWSASEADAFNIKESARIYAEASGVSNKEWLIEDAVQKFIEYNLEGLKSKRDYLREFAQLYYIYANRSINELSAVCEEINKLTKVSKVPGSKPVLLAASTRRNKIRYLCSACNYAFKKHGFGDHMPSERVSVPNVKNARQNAPNRSDMLRIARLMPRGDARTALICAFYSGMLRGEVIRAVVKARAFMLRDTKNGKPRVITAHPKLTVYLKNFPLQMKDHQVFSRFRKAWNKLGLDDFTFHDFRHGAASEMINNGVSLNTVGKVLGHLSPISTQRYAHLNISTLRDAVNSIGKSGKIYGAMYGFCTPHSKR